MLKKNQVISMLQLSPLLPYASSMIHIKFFTPMPYAT